MKKVLFIMLVFFQSNYGQLHHSSFSSSSINHETKSVAVLQTVGQLSPIGSYFSNNIAVVQGFHQPFLKTKNTVELINNESIITFPNPFNSDLNIKFNNIKPQNLQVDLYDLNGRFIKSFNVNKVDDILTLTLKNLISSEYIIRLRARNLDYSTKIIKK